MNRLRICVVVLISCVGLSASSPPVAALAPRGDVGSVSAVQASPRWGWPIGRPRVVLRKFHPPPRRWLPGHRGVDLVANEGDPVRAVGAGRVAFVGQVAGKGVVSIEHGGLRSTYEPVQAGVIVGQTVARGYIIGVVHGGASHCSPAKVVICLHWGVRRGMTYIDPLSLLSRHARLLPLG